VIRAEAPQGNWSTVTPSGQLSQLEMLTGVETRRIHIDKAYRGPSLSGFIG
jgi:hypothetical protein